MRCFPLVFLAFLWCVVSCQTDRFEDTGLPVDVTLPLADFNITDSALFAWGGIQDYISKDDNGALQIESALDFMVGDRNDLQNIFTLDNQQYDFHFDFSNYGFLTGTVPVTEGLLEFTTEFSFSNGARLKEAKLSSGSWSFEIRNSRSDFSGMVCTVPQLTKNGKPLQGRPGDIIRLEGYTLTFDTEESLISFNLSGDIKVMPGDDLSDVGFGFTLDECKIKEAQGYLGRWEIDPGRLNTGTFSGSVTDFYKDCDYYLADPQLTLQIDNGFNIPALVVISRFSLGGKEIALKDRIGGSKIYLEPDKITRYTLSNSSTVNGTALSDVLSSDISGYTIGFRIILNPSAQDMGDVSYQAPQYNEITAEDSISAGAVMRIPLYGLFKNLVFKEKVKFGDLKPPKDSRYDYLLLAVACENQLPLGLEFSLIAVSAEGGETILLDEPILIPPSNGLKPDGPGFLPGKTDENNPVIYKIPGDRVEAFLTARDLILEFTGTTYMAESGQAVRFYSPSELKMRLIANVKGEI